MLALRCNTQRENYFSKISLSNAGKELMDADLLLRTFFEDRNSATEDKIIAMVGVSLFDCFKVDITRDDHERVFSIFFTDSTNSATDKDTKTFWTSIYPSTNLLDFGDEPITVSFWLAHEEICKTSGLSWTDTWEFAE